MSTATTEAPGTAQPAAREFPLAAPWARWKRGILVLAMVLTAFGFSLWSVLRSTFDGTTTGLLFLVPALTIALVLITCRVKPGYEYGKRDLFTDGFFTLPIFLVALMIQFAMPVQLSWFFWLQRLDLLALPLFLTGCIMLFWGTPTMRSVGVAVIYSLLIWPVPFQALRDGFLPLWSVLGDLLGAAGATFVPASALPWLLDGALVWFTFGAFWLALATVSPLRAGAYLLLGSLLAGVLFAGSVTGATLLGIEGGILVPLNATVLAILAGIALSALMRIRLRATPQPNRPIWLADKVKLPAGMVAVYLLLAVGMGALDANLARYGDLNPQALPRVPGAQPGALLPNIPGWRLEPLDTLDLRAVFGATTRAGTWRYFPDEGSPLDVQVVLGTSAELLDTAGLEASRLIHLDEVVALRDADLGQGVTARLVETLPLDADPSSLLYWVVPVDIGETRLYARFAVSVPVDGRLAFPPAAPPNPSAITRIQSGLNTLAQPLDPFTEAEFRDAGELLRAVGSLIVRDGLLTAEPARAGPP